ncbi:MAG: gamma-glutamyltransferase [candidate division NC10 bacterium]|mgnify:CR=1 FL=1
MRSPLVNVPASYARRARRPIEREDPFYSGATAEAITRAVREARHNPAPLTAADLAAYRAKTREAVCLPYRAQKVCSNPSHPRWRPRATASGWARWTAA